MKRLALALASLGVIVSSALASGSAQAYQPEDDESLIADPGVVASGGDFDAVLEGCFPGVDGVSGEQILFINLGVSPVQVAWGTCQLPAYEARVTFQAPLDEGVYEIVAILPLPDPDDLTPRPDRVLEAFYQVSDESFPIVPTGGGPEGGVTAISTGTSGDIWPSFMSSVGFYRTFLALLALLAGIIFVLLWRRRREDERIEGSYPIGTVPPPPDPNHPSMA